MIRTLNRGRLGWHSYGATSLPIPSGRSLIRPLDHRTDPPAFSPRVYKLRNKVERFFSRIKHYRAVATRFDKDEANFLASRKLAAIRIWMRFSESVT